MTGNVRLLSDLRERALSGLPRRAGSSLGRLLPSGGPSRISPRPAAATPRDRRARDARRYRECGAVVAKPFLDAFDVHPAAQQQRGEMVPKLMHPGAALVLGLPSGDCHGTVTSPAAEIEPNFDSENIDCTDGSAGCTLDQGTGPGQRSVTRGRDGYALGTARPPHGTRSARRARGAQRRLLRRAYHPGAAELRGQRDPDRPPPGAGHRPRRRQAGRGRRQPRSRAARPTPPRPTIDGLRGHPRRRAARAVRRRCDPGRRRAPRRT